MAQKAPGATQAMPTSSASRFGGWRGVLMGGLVAAALASIFGFGALASVLGFVLQAALIAGIVYLVLMFIRGRSQPALARAASSGSKDRASPTDFLQRQTKAYGSAAGSSASAVNVSQQDLDTFERLLGEIQDAYGREDVDRLGALTTPEMLSYFSADLADNAKRGVRNEIGEVKLLQGDLSEAWRENGSEYATVAMRYALTDAIVDRSKGSVISGDPAKPTQTTEFWTFRRDDRDRPADWQLSAIQQAA
jgi:predicted lipid-binding transport protein (Tim44 family)